MFRTMLTAATVALVLGSMVYANRAAALADCVRVEALANRMVPGVKELKPEELHIRAQLVINDTLTSLKLKRPETPFSILSTCVGRTL